MQLSNPSHFELYDSQVIEFFLQQHTVYMLCSIDIIILSSLLTKSHILVT